MSEDCIGVWRISFDGMDLHCVVLTFESVE